MITAPLLAVVDEGMLVVLMIHTLLTIVVPVVVVADL
jgi:hypothetical protein